MAVRLDKIAVSSLHPSFHNYSTQTGTITVSGTIAAGGTSFTTTIPYSRAASIADIYVTKTGSLYKRAVDNIVKLTEYGGSTSAYVSAGYTSTDVTLRIDVSGSGAPYAAPTETYTFTVVLYDAPLSA